LGIQILAHEAMNLRAVRDLLHLYMSPRPKQFIDTLFVFGPAFADLCLLVG
jgi:hypothetical protein